MKEIIYLDMSASFLCWDGFREAVEDIKRKYIAGVIEQLILFGSKECDVTEFLPDILEALTHIGLTGFEATSELVGDGSYSPDLTKIYAKGIQAVTVYSDFYWSKWCKSTEKLTVLFLNDHKGPT